jgi:uncharacterized membrane protein
MPKWFRTGDDVTFDDESKVREWGGVAVDVMHVSPSPVFPCNMARQEKRDLSFPLTVVLVMAPSVWRLGGNTLPLLPLVTTFPIIDPNNAQSAYA